MASYEHPYWGNYAAITRNHYGEGVATYVGCCPSDEVVEKIIEEAVKQAGLWGIDQEIRFPLIVKSGNNGQGNKVQYYFNYSGEEHMLLYPYPKGIDLLTDQRVQPEELLSIGAWGVCIVEEEIQ